MKNRLSLPDTGLHITESTLVRQTSENEVTLSLPLESITQLRLKRTPSEFSIVLLGSALAVVYLAMEIAEGTGLRIALSMLAILVGSFAILGFLKQLLIIESNQGVVRVEVSDSRDVCEGFVHSVNALLNAPKKVPS